MKLRGMKVVALAMSALMVTSAVPVASFADDAEFYFEEEVADEALVGAEEDEGYFVDFDAEEDFVVEDFEEDFEIVGDETTPAENLEDEEFTFVEDSVEYSGKDNIFNYKETGKPSGKTYNRTVEGKGGNVVAPTCAHEGYTAYQVTIYSKSGAILYDKAWEVNKQAKLDHEWEESPFKTDYTKLPTCEDPGEGTAYYHCKNCTEIDERDVKTEIESQGHKVSSYDTYYKAGKNTKLDESGNPVLVDPQKNGEYTVYKKGICSKCGLPIWLTKDNEQKKEETVYSTEKILALEEKYCFIYDVSDSVAESGKNLLKGARSDDANPIIDADGNLLIPITDIEMTDCSKGGSYTVFFMNGDTDVNDEFAPGEKNWASYEGNKISFVTFLIDPHHYLGEMEFEFDSEIDYKQVKEIYDEKDKTKVIGFKNMNCSREITYYEVQHCKAKGKCTLPKCPVKNNWVYDGGTHTDETGYRIYGERKAVVLPKSTDHVINTNTKKNIAKLVKDYPNGIPFEKLEDEAKKDGSYIKVIDNEPKSCDAGTATVQYICKVCGIVAETETVKRAKRAHDWSPIIRELVKDSTCTEKGVYNEYIMCRRCGLKKEGTERTVNKPLKPHEYTQNPTIKFVGGVVVDWNGSLVASAGTNDKFQYVGLKAGEDVNVSEDLCVAAKVVDVCKNCGKEIVVEDATYDIQVVSVNPSEYSCIPGDITIKATGKNGTKDIPAVTASFPYYKSINSYQGRTKHDPGKPEADGTVKCTICGQVITEGQGGETPCDHEAGEATMENIVEASCGKEGSYDLVVKCKKCGEVISTTKVTQEALEHSYGEWQTVVTRTVFQKGKQSRYCANCNKRQTKYLPKLTSICSLDKSSVTVKVGSKVSVKVVKRHRGDTIGSVSSANESIAKGFKASSYIAYISGKKVGTTTFTVKMKAGASASCTVKVVKK